MSRRQRKRAELPRPELNITSMMDLVLNLVALFTILSSLAAAALPAMKVPNPSHSLAKPWEGANKIFLSLVANPINPWQVGQVVVGDTKIAPGDLAQITNLLQKEVKLSPSVQIYLRADQRLKYAQVQPYMIAVASSGAKDIHYVALPKE